MGVITKSQPALVGVDISSTAVKLLQLSRAGNQSRKSKAQSAHPVVVSRLGLFSFSGSGSMNVKRHLLFVPPQGRHRHGEVAREHRLVAALLEQVRS